VFVRLTSKLANSLDGIDVTHVRVGDVIDLSEKKAASLIAEGWAERVPAHSSDPAPSQQRDPTSTG
jgi:hypothetical protein